MSDTDNTKVGCEADDQCIKTTLDANNSKLDAMQEVKDEPETKLELQKNDLLKSSSSDAWKEDQECDQNYDMAKEKEARINPNVCTDSKILTIQEKTNCLPTKAEDIKVDATAKNEILQKPEVDPIITVNKSESNNDISTGELENCGSTNELSTKSVINNSFQESQEPQQLSSHNQSETSLRQEFDSQDASSQNYDNLSPKIETNRCDSITSKSTENNNSFECNNDLSQKDALQALKEDTQGMDNADTAIESNNQDEGLQKLSQEEGIETSEGNQESQSNKVNSDTYEDSSNYTSFQTTNQTDKGNEESIVENSQITSNQDTNTQSTSHDPSSVTVNLNDVNAESAQPNVKPEHGYKDDRTNDSDVNSAVSYSNPSAMTSDNAIVKEEESQEALEQQNTVYSNSKSNSPNNRNNATNCLSNSSHQGKDDPYNFSEEEDVFSPQLPTRQFSSSNTTNQQGDLPGSESNDPAMDRLKAEHR